MPVLSEGTARKCAKMRHVLTLAHWVCRRSGNIMAILATKPSKMSPFGPLEHGIDFAPGSSFEMDKKKTNNGQSLVEYAFILVLIVTILMIATLSLISGKTSNTYNEMANGFPAKQEGP